MIPLRVAVKKRRTCDPVGMDTIRQSETAFGLLVRFRLLPGREAEFDALAASTVAAISECEPGTLLYATHTVENEPRDRVFYELYRDRTAFEAHEAQPHVHHFLTEREHLIESFTVDWLHPTAHTTAPGGGT